MKSKRETSPTMRDVARASGVSAATVSHVLSGREKRVSAETRERVLAAMRELRYRPTPQVDKQNPHKTRTISFIVGQLSQSPILRHDYFAHLLDGALEACALNGYSMTILVEQMWDRLGREMRASFDGRCDGVIMLAPGEHDPMIPVLLERGLPVVALGSSFSIPGVSTVDSDNEQGAVLAVQHLWSLGHRKIAYIGARPSTVSSVERYLGYQRGMIECGGVEVECFAIFSSASSSDEAARGFSDDSLPTPESRAIQVEGWGEAAFRALRASYPECTAVVCWNDDLGRTFCREALAQGVRVPEDLSVTAFDTTPNQHQDYPKLTTLRQQLPKIGKAGVEVLLSRVTNPDQPDSVTKFATELIVCESTSSPRPMKHF